MFNLNTYKFSIILILLIHCCFCSSYSSEIRFTKLDSILKAYDANVEEYVKETEIPGLAIAIVINNRIEYIKGFGVTNTISNKPISIHSTFRIASVSKGFASVLAGLLVKDGLLKWDGTIKSYLPQFELQDSSTTNHLTIQHILNHTSGLTPHAYDNLIEANMSFDKIVERLKEVKIHCSPGECYGYQNTVYSLIGSVIFSRTGKNYIENLQKRILIPLGMNDASLSKSAFMEDKDRADPHIFRNGSWKPSEIRDTYYNVPPAAGINASIYDMAYWLKALLGGNPDIISPEIITQVTKPLINTPSEKRRFNWKNRIKYAAYGMGWRIFDYEGYTMIYHGGGLHGYLSQIAFFPKEKIGIIMLQNARIGNNCLYKFIDLYFNIKQEENLEKAAR